MSRGGNKNEKTLDLFSISSLYNHFKNISYLFKATLKCLSCSNVYFLSVGPFCFESLFHVYWAVVTTP